MGKRGDVLKNKSYHVWNMENRIRVEEDELAYRERKAKKREQRERRKSEVRYKRLKGEQVSDISSSGEETPSDEMGYTWDKKKKSKEEKQRDYKRRQHEKRTKQEEELERKRDECYTKYNNLPKSEKEQNLEEKANPPSVLENNKHVHLFEEEEKSAGIIKQQQFVEKTHLNRGHKVIDKVVDKMDMTHAFGGGKSGTANPWWTKERKMTSRRVASSDDDLIESKQVVKRKKEKKTKKMSKEEKYAALRREREDREAIEAIRARDYHQQLTMSGMIQLDALPYIDPPLSKDMREYVEGLIDEEMNRFEPEDYLSDMPMPQVEVSKMIRNEMERVAAGRAPPPLDRSRFDLAPPARDDEQNLMQWNKATNNAKAQYAHQLVRQQNLEMLSNYGKDTWLDTNKNLISMGKEIDGEIESAKNKIQELNQYRRHKQKRASARLHQNESQCKDYLMRNALLETELYRIDQELKRIRRW